MWCIRPNHPQQIQSSFGADNIYNDDPIDRVNIIVGVGFLFVVVAHSNIYLLYNSALKTNGNITRVDLNDDDVRWDINNFF